MAFENVDVDSLKSAIISCKNSIKHGTSEELKTKIMNSSIWQCDSKEKLENALMMLTDTRYKDLERKLDEYLEAANHIEKYKNYEQTNRKLKMSMISFVKNDDGANDNKIRELDRKIKENEREMANLERKVQNII